MITTGDTTYERMRREFRLDVPEHFNWARDVVGQWAREQEKRAMLWTDENGARREISFAEFDERSSRLAAGLRDRGIGKGDRVLVILPPVPEWWETFLALLKLGAVAVPGTSQLTPRDIVYRYDAAGARGLIVDADGVEKADEALAEREDPLRIVVGPEHGGWLPYEQILMQAPADFAVEDTLAADPAILYFTSGTTGYPKMVLHTQSSYPLGHVITGKYWLDLEPDDLHWNLADTGWAKAAWSSLFGPWNQGAAVFVYRMYGKPDPDAILSQFQKHQITTFCGPPTIYRMLVTRDLSKYDFGHLRRAVAAGEPLNPEVIQVWKDGTGLTIADGYGQTETVVIVANFPDVPIKPGSMGLPSPGFDIGVIDDDGNELPPDREGDIAVRIAPHRPVALFAEYWHNPVATAAAFRGDWYITGDRAVRDQDGYLWFVGRADDVIISAAYRIGPFEVESALIEHPAVVEAAVVGKPDPQRGQIVKAYVILAEGYSPSDELVAGIQNHVKSVTAPYKYPREIEFVTELPKTISGKIRRIELREREQA